MQQRPLRELFDAVFHGKYRFEEFLELDPSEHRESVSWKNRTIYKPSEKLRNFHRLISSFLIEHLTINENAAFAYRKGGTPLQAVKPHADSKAFFQTDLEKFFESIRTRHIRETIERANVPIADLQCHLEHIISLITIDETLPIGYSTSPPLSNACMAGFDELMTSVATRKGWVYTRYADDIIVSSSDKAHLAAAQELIEMCLDEALGPGFRLNPLKTKLTFAGQRIKLLGLLILPNGKVSLDKDIRNRIETSLHFYVRSRERLAAIFQEQGLTNEEGLQQMGGLLSHANAADPTYVSKLRRKFGATVIDSVLHRTAT